MHNKLDLDRFRNFSVILVLAGTQVASESSIISINQDTPSRFNCQKWGAFLVLMLNNSILSKYFKFFWMHSIQMAFRYLEIGQGFGKAWGINSLIQGNTAQFADAILACPLPPELSHEFIQPLLQPKPTAGRRGNGKGKAAFCMSSTRTRWSQRGCLAGLWGRAGTASSFGLQGALEFQLISLKGTLGLQLCTGWALEQSWGFLPMKI